MGVANLQTAIGQLKHKPTRESFLEKVTRVNLKMRLKARCLYEGNGHGAGSNINTVHWQHSLNNKLLVIKEIHKYLRQSPSDGHVSTVAKGPGCVRLCTAVPMLCICGTWPEVYIRRFI